MRPLLSIQYLRALAALSVAVFHAFQWARLDFYIGAAGVDIFFVISGFIMWRTTEGTDVRPLEFLRRRAVRIAPSLPPHASAPPGRRWLHLQDVSAGPHRRRS
jgi:peptidoglycan/LPS O-acetylase OafA/YrhL